MDWDIEMDDVSHLEDEAITTEPEAQQSARIGLQTEDQIDAPASLERDTESATLVLRKIHVRGLDILTTEDIKSYVAEHFGEVDKVEWIDDTSANLVFKSESTAQEALISLSSVQVADPTQLPPLECLPAKPVPGKPDINLHVRFAMASDRKQAGASTRSRFYLLHPEYDPEERRRQGGGAGGNYSRYRDRDSGSSRYRRDDRDRRRSYGDGDELGGYFDASFYDDDEDALASRSLETRHRRRSPRRRRGSEREEEKGEASASGSAWGSASGSRHNSSRELFPNRQGAARHRDRRRSRSASPTRDRDVLLENRSSARRVKSQLAATNSSKELFPSKSSASGIAQIDQLEKATRGAHISGPVGRDSFHIRGTAVEGEATMGFSIKGASASNARELFPAKLGTNAGRELFAERLEGRGKRRQKAEDMFY